MKGFVGGVPVALLAAAALAQAQESIRGPAQMNGANNVRRHHMDHVPGGNAVIGGPGGSDKGNDAGIDFDSEFSSEVNDAHGDDHGVDVNKGTDYHPHPVETDVEQPFPNPFPVPFLDDIPGPTRKRQFGNTAIGGTSGSDYGNAADIDLESDFSSEVNEGAIPVPYRRRAKRQGNTLIGGPGGSDDGNTASYDSENDFDSEVNDLFADDHHVDYDELNNIHPHPIKTDINNPVHHYPVPVVVKRQGDTVIGGPGGSDDGNTASYDSENEFESEVNDLFTDDHHVDYDELNNIHPHPIKTDINNPVHHYPVPVVVKRQGDTLIGGPGGSDDGNTASYDSENEFESDVKDAFADDHHLDYDELNDIHPHPVKTDINNPVHHYPVPVIVKRQGDTLIGGPGGSDDGNTASYDAENEFESDVKDAFADDHHLDYDELNDIHPHPVKTDINNPVHHYPVPVIVKRQGNSVMGGPGGSDKGNDADYESENEVESEVNDLGVDDHHIDYDELNNVHPHPVYNEAVVADVVGVPFHKPLIVKREGQRIESRTPDNLDLDSDSDSDSDSDDKHHRTPFKGGNTIIGGPGGSDSGNDADIDFENDFDSELNDAFKDDHHIDYDEANNIHPHPVYNKVDSYPVGAPVPVPLNSPLMVKRQDKPATGGHAASNSGSDVGSGSEHEIESEVNDAHQGDHHTDASVFNDIGGGGLYNHQTVPQGIPGANADSGLFGGFRGPAVHNPQNPAGVQGSEMQGGAQAPGSQDGAQEPGLFGGFQGPAAFGNARGPAASNSAEPQASAHGPSMQAGAQGPGLFGFQGPAAFGNAEGPAASNIPQPPTGTHGMAMQAGAQGPGSQAGAQGAGVFGGLQGPAAFGNAEGPAASNIPQPAAGIHGMAMQAGAQASESQASAHGPASQNVPPCSTVFHEVVHTVTQTLPSQPKGTHMAMSSAVPMAPFVHHAPASSDLAAYGANKDFLGSQHASPTGAIPNAASHAVQHPASTMTLHQTGSSLAHMHAMPTGAVPGVATPGAQHSASTVTLHRTPSSSAHNDVMPSGAMPIGATHPAQQPASTLTLQAASTFVGIPVYVPGASSVPSSSGAAPVGSSHSTVAKASQYAPASSTPAKHHGMMFTGGAAAFSPNTALVSVFCGAVALLAYAL